MYIRNSILPNPKDMVNLDTLLDKTALVLGNKKLDLPKIVYNTILYLSEIMEMAIALSVYLKIKHFQLAPPLSIMF